MKIYGLLSIVLVIAAAGPVAAQTPAAKFPRRPLCNNLAISLPPPDFSKAEAGASGVVNVQATIDEAGNVAAARAVSGDPQLRGAAERAALKAKFRVTTYRRKPVKISCVIVYNIERAAGPVRDTQAESKTPKLGIINGRAVDLRKPDYPAAARVCAGGKVEVEVLVGENGEVLEARAVYGDELLRAAAVAAAKKSTFQPTHDVPVEYRGLVVYNFDGFVECADGGIVNQKAKSLPPAKRPENCRCSGTVEVAVVIDVLRGTVARARAVSGEARLRAAAVEAAKRATFHPSFINIDRRVFVKGVLVYRF